MAIVTVIGVVVVLIVIAAAITGVVTVSSNV